VKCNEEREHKAKKKELARIEEAKKHKAKKGLFSFSDISQYWQWS